MKSRLFPNPLTALRISQSLLAVLLAVACSPPVGQTIPSGLPTSTELPPAAPTSTPLQQVVPTLDAATQVQAPTEAPPATPLPVATSRGPNLEATDPTTVKLDSGGLQLIEFFRFT